MKPLIEVTLFCNSNDKIETGLEITLSKYKNLTKDETELIDMFHVFQPNTDIKFEFHVCYIWDGNFQLYHTWKSSAFNKRFSK